MSAYSGRAADLPEGSILGYGLEAYAKAGRGNFHWRCTNEYTYSCASIDELIAVGAEVLRVGDGR